MATTSCPELKVILCGEYGVGKTSLFRRFSAHTYIDTSTMSAAQSRQSTLGLDHFSRKFDGPAGKSLKLQLWDTGGLERVASTTHSYYKFSKAALLVYSLDNLESFHCLCEHLLEILRWAENAKIFLVGNKLDLHSQEVSQSDIDVFLEQFPTFSGIFRISCKTNEGIDDMLTEIVEKLSGDQSLRANPDTFQLHAHTDGDCCGAGDEPTKKDFCCAK